MFKNKTILITGGTGSFGTAFVSKILKEKNPRKVIVFSRDEMKQWEMSKKFNEDKRLRFFIGDVRDKNRLYRAFEDVDFVIHAAATKIVPTAEYNPFECIKTNVIGSMNVIDAAIDKNVSKIIALSTDKASEPINLYGASKLASDKLFVAANAYSTKGPKFSVVRYGNVMGSRGSVIPFFVENSKKGKLPITNFEMTRFMITVEEGVEFVWKAINLMNGGEIFVKKLPSMNIVEIAKAVCEKCQLVEVGIRPGEKIHEQMISVNDALYTYEYKEYFKILSNLDHLDNSNLEGGKKVKNDFCYSSENNDTWMSKSELKKWIRENNLNQ